LPRNVQISVTRKLWDTHGISQLTQHSNKCPGLTQAIYSVGMDFYVVLERPGYRVGRRRRAVSTVGIQHKVTKEDAMKW